jgi:hypothetical protein
MTGFVSLVTAMSLCTFTIGPGHEDSSPESAMEKIRTLATVIN